jgi:5-methylcytosine-specific restriction endonuclease McrA
MARRVKYYSAKRRAVYAAGEDIDHLTVFERDNWTCGICGGLIDRRVRKPSPNAASIDHITEISKCLDMNWPIEEIHTYANVQAAHLGCNLDKSQQRVLDSEPTESYT